MDEPALESFLQPLDCLELINSLCAASGIQHEGNKVLEICLRSPDSALKLVAAFLGVGQRAVLVQEAVRVQSRKSY